MKRVLVVMLCVGIVGLLIGCAGVKLGGASESKEVDYPEVQFDKAFDMAIRTLNEVGMVTTMSKEGRFVNGKMKDIELGVTIDPLTSGGVRVSVKGVVPQGFLKIGGGMSELDEFLDKYAQYIQ
ncbi:hypothetical protein JXO59_05625 [candidate division KSB1 bacterium]|nr:hypothetical protein [candidate division KSB1 bacterium]